MNIFGRLFTKLKLKHPEKKQISSKVIARIIHDLKEGTEISVVKTDGTALHGIFLEGRR